MKELTNEINQNYLTYYFKGNADREIFDNFNNGIELLWKIKSCEMKLEKNNSTKAKYCRMCLNQIWTKYQEKS